MFASILNLTNADMIAMRVTDPYSIHRVVYDLFEDVRTEIQKNSSESSGFLYVDKGGSSNNRSILIISDRPPKNPKRGQVILKEIPDAFLLHEQYLFEVIINPTRRDSKSGKLIPLKLPEDISKWFSAKSLESWGFTIQEETLRIEDVHANKFNKGNVQVIHASAKISGKLSVVNREKFIISFKNGIGRGRAFGFGLLQLQQLIK